MAKHIPQRACVACRTVRPKRHLVRVNDALNVKADLQVARDETQAARIHFVRLMMEASGLIRCNQRRVEALQHVQVGLQHTSTRIFWNSQYASCDSWYFSCSGGRQGW